MVAIAIDGPSGAGKSTLAKRLAAEYGYIYVDTGAMYRAIGLFVLENNKDTKNADEVAELLPKIKLSLAYENGAQHIYLNGRDVSDEIRKEPVSMAASDVSAHSTVRSFLLDTQRNFTKTNNVIMDGRDIGTVILPNAEIKIFLTAKPEARAQRRFNELVEKGAKTDYETVLKDVIQRDYNDTNRPIAPLKQAQDAVLVDTTLLDFEQSYEALKNVINGKI